MQKVVFKGFTDYFGERVQKVELLKYDNDKYATVRLEDGTVDEVKRGYLYRDEALSRKHCALTWHLLGGGSRKSFKQRHRKISYLLSRENVVLNRDPLEQQAYSTLKEAIAAGKLVAKKFATEVLIHGLVETRWRSQLGYRMLKTGVDGLAFEFQGEHKPIKFLRGHGKVTPINLPPHRG